MYLPSKVYVSTNGAFPYSRNEFKLRLGLILHQERIPGKKWTGRFSDLMEPTTNMDKRRTFFVERKSSSYHGDKEFHMLFVGNIHKKDKIFSYWFC